MPLLYKNIRRRLIKRLLFGWLFVSTVTGTVIFFIEMERIDDFVVKLALDESSYFISDGTERMDIDLSQYEKLLEISQHQIRERHFIIAEFYDKSKKQIIEVAHPQSEHIEQEINKHKHELLMTDKVEYGKYFISGDLYLLVLVPLKMHNGEIRGYFEGVYRVDTWMLDNLKKGIFWSLVTVVIVVFATTASLYPIIISLNKDLINLSVDLSKANIGMLKALGGAISKRDSDTHTHNYRVTLYAVRLAEVAGLNEDAIRALIKGAFLHDIGKIAISDNILLKQGGLSPEEFGVMKTHVRHGIDIIGKYDWLSDAVDVVGYHHERFDGCGYAAGLKGEDIPIIARIFTIADYFDALTSSRPYKESFPFEKAMQILDENRGKHFDPHMLDLFCKSAAQLYNEISKTEDAALEKALDSIIDRYFYGA